MTSGIVFRFYKPSDDEVFRQEFPIDSISRKKLSVWNVELTTEHQAAVLMGWNGAAAKVTWNVEEVSRIEESGRCLSVDPDPLDDPRPGADGHCNILGLELRGFENAKGVFRSLRSQLHDILTDHGIVIP